MTKFSTLAAVDLGSNSFNLQIARVVNDQIYPLDSIREPVIIAAGLTEDKYLNIESQTRALECLKRFGERLGTELTLEPIVRTDSETARPS